MSDSQWIPITSDMKEYVYQYAGSAIERLESFGMDERRESAYALILAGAAPLAGMLLLGWAPVVVVATLLINLLLGLTEDIIKIIRSHGHWDETMRACVEDEYVWPVAQAMARGRRTVFGRHLASSEGIEQGRTQQPLWFAAVMAYAVAGGCLPLLYGPGAALGQGEWVFLGSLPSLVFSLALGLIHGLNHHPHWRLGGSVRLQTSALNGFFIAALGLVPFLILTAPSDDPLLSENELAFLGSAATVAYGAYRVLGISGLRHTARWLKRSM